VKWEQKKITRRKKYLISFSKQFYSFAFHGFSWKQNNALFYEFKNLAHEMTKYTLRVDCETGCMLRQKILELVIVASKDELMHFRYSKKYTLHSCSYRRKITARKISLHCSFLSFTLLLIMFICSTHLYEC